MNLASTTTARPDAETGTLATSGAFTWLPIALVMLWGRARFWNDKCDFGFVEKVVVRVLQFKGYLVRAGRKTHQDHRVSARIRPNPRRIIESHMYVPDTRGSSQGAGAEHRLKMNVLGTILNNNHAA